MDDGLFEKVSRCLFAFVTKKVKIKQTRLKETVLANS